MVGADTHRNGLWACMVGVEIKRHARDLHMDNVWLAQRLIGMAVGVYGWLRDQETCMLKCMVGAESGKKGMLTWLFVQRSTDVQMGMDGVCREAEKCMW